VIGETVSHYRVLDRIGGGGMGVVYRAEDVSLGRIVALKFLNPALISNESNRKRFLREAQAASLIDHPNVCHVYQVEETDDGRLFIAMAYYGGRSLRGMMEEGPLSPRQAFEIGFSIAQGLWAAHRRGIVHRDIKPGNVVVSDDGFVKIVDFGLALLMGQSRVTTGGARVGTVAYMSPEQASGAEVDARTDIWSLGVVMYEAMTGRLPFRGEVDAALVFSIRSEAHTPLLEAKRDVPESCARVVERCLAKSPEDRYTDVEALLADMVAAANECGWGDTVASRTIAPILAAKRRQAWTRRAVVGAVVVAVAAGGAWLWSRRGPPSPYSTEMRVAVLPFENHLGPDQADFVAGACELTSRVTQWVGRLHPSMWTVRQRYVNDAELPDAKAAADAFGVNRVVTGDVQRFGNGRRLNLVLRDASTLDAIRSEFIDFDDTDARPVVNEAAPVMARLVGMEESALAARSPWREDDASSASLLIEGLGLSDSDDEGALHRAFALLDSSAARGTASAITLAAAGTAAYRVYRRSRDAAILDRAEARARESLARSPDMEEAYVALGFTWLAREQPDSAIAMFEKACEVDPGNAEATHRLALALIGESRLDEAEGVYRGAIAARPDCWIEHRMLGTFYLKQERLDEAADALGSAVELAPHDMTSLNNLGVVYYRKGNWGRFRDLSLEAFRIRPGCSTCNNVATALYFEGKYAESAQYFELALSPEYCDSTEHLAWGNLARSLYWVDGQRDSSVTLFRKAAGLARDALATTPDDAGLIGNLIDYCAMSSDVACVRELMARADPLLTDDERLMYRVGAAYEALGQRELALHHLGDAFRHGMPLPEIIGDPMLRDLVADPRFKEMVRSDAAVDGAKTATTNQ
jgi:eukaryotic-like serine/threonine-protein kinase